MNRESWWRRLLKLIGIIKSYEVSKSEMCKRAQSVCNKHCDSCAWNEQMS